MAVDAVLPCDRGWSRHSGRLSGEIKQQEIDGGGKKRQLVLGGSAVVQLQRKEAKALPWCCCLTGDGQKRSLEGPAGAYWVNATSHLLRWYEAGVQTAGEQLLVAAPSAARHRRHGGMGRGGLERRRGCRVEGGQARDAGRRAGSRRSDAVGEARTQLVLVRRRVADGEALGGAVAEP